MIAETEPIVFTESALASMETEKLTGLLAEKTEHLLVASRCKLPGHMVQDIRKKVKLLQVIIMRRKIEDGAHSPKN